jgi:hypothetical protein
MRYTSSLVAIVCIASSLRATEPPAGFISLWNGKDLAGWHYMDTLDPRKLAAMSEADRASQLAKWAKESDGHWSIDGDTIVNDGKGAYLTTDKDYGDIELLIEYKMAPRGDSGIYLRGCPQVQIWDKDDPGNVKNGSDKGSGGLWNNTRGKPGQEPLVLADKPMGEWNKFRIIQVGERVSVWLNDKLVVDHARLENYFEKDRRNPLPRTGPIQLQTHGGEIRWRNLFVREIGADEANTILRGKHADGYRRVFNGQDLTGWAGAVDSYEVKDAAIVCRPKKGGTVYTNDQFGDFAARFDFRLPPGGNNGLAIRYPGDPSGKMDTAYNGMCEIQVLDDPHPMYEKLDPRQFNGSAYGMVAAKRGYLRPTGDWNFEEVTVQGSTIVVELNGTRILDCDLSKVTDYMGGRPHLGKDRTAGHFGFAGHNDPVAFRNIEIKALK